MKLFLKIFLLFLCAFAPLREVFAAGALFTGPVIVNGSLQLATSTNAPLGSAVTTNTSGGAWGGGGTQTLFYAVQSTNGLGSSALGRTVAGIVVSTNNALRIKWNLTAGADAIFLWRGSATNTLTNYVRLAASVTNYTDTGTNTWSNGTVTITATNTPRIVFADGTSLSSTNGLGGGGGGGSGTLTGAVVGAGSSYRLTSTNNGTANATLNFDATGLATGTPLYVQSETNANARLASNVWASADSTTNYYRRTDGITLSNSISALFMLNRGDSANTLNYSFTAADGAASDGGGFSFKAGDDNTHIGNGGNYRFAVGYGASVGSFTIELDPENGDGSGGGNVVVSNGNLRVVNGQFVGAGAGLSDINSGVLTNLGAGLAISGGKLTAQGNGSGLTNVNAATLNGFTGSDLTSNTVKIVATQPLSASTSSAGGTNTTTISIAATALMRNQRGFIFRGSEGSLQAAFVEPIHIPPGGDYISVRTATNALTVNNFIQTLSTITATSIAYVAFNHMQTGAIPWVVVANQPVGDYVFSAYDYSGAQSVAITQTVAAAGTWYYTNLPLSINAFIGKIEARVRTTNSANIYQGGIDVRVSP